MIYDFRRPITEQGKPDIFDLQARAQAEDLKHRVCLDDKWEPPLPKLEVAAADEAQPVYRYSSCPSNPVGFSHSLPYGPVTAGKDVCIYCRRRLTLA